jgi:hypothetical protein
MAKKTYIPLRKKYNDLRSLYTEMVDQKVKVILFNGAFIETKNQRWGMFEGELIVWDI